MKKILVVEDEEINVKNAARAFEGLAIEVNFTQTYEEALLHIDEADAAVLDIFFPENKDSQGDDLFQEFLRAQKRPENADEFRLTNGLLPLGIILAKKLRDAGKPAVFVSNISTGHGFHDSPFYVLRKSFKNMIPEAWNSSEAPGMIWAFVSQALAIKDGYGFQNIEKSLAGWRSAIKSIATLMGLVEIAQAIALAPEVERKMAVWLKEFYGR
jgi:CheY-like chemotaxis protein